MKKLYLLIVCLSAVIFTYSCKRTGEATPEKPKCAYTSADNQAMLNQRWANTFTQIDTYNSTGTTKTTTVIYPLGYFQLNTDNTYNVFSDNVPLNGKWAINTNCQLVLDSTNVVIQRDFDVLTLTKDSLTIRRKQNNIVYTQHYKTFACPTSANLVYRWDNFYIRSDYFINGTTNIGFSSNDYTQGYFTLNADATYNVVSGSDVRGGKWTINQTGCRLVLDQNTSTERSFEMLKVSTDSLVIWRKDVSANAAYTQHYKKH